MLSQASETGPGRRSAPPLFPTPRGLWRARWAFWPRFRLPEKRKGTQSSPSPSSKEGERTPVPVVKGWRERVSLVPLVRKTKTLAGREKQPGSQTRAAMEGGRDGVAALPYPCNFPKRPKFQPCPCSDGLGLSPRHFAHCLASGLASNRQSAHTLKANITHPSQNPPAPNAKIRMFI